MPKEEVKRRKKRRRKVRRGRVAAALILLMLIVVGIAAALSLTVFFNINSISVAGSSRYSADEIIDASNIAKGQNMFRLDTKKAESSVAKRLPYITVVKVQRVLPDSIKITVKENKVDYAFKNGESYVLATGMKAVDNSDTVPDGAVVVSCRIKSCKLGEDIVLDDVSTLEKIRDAISESKIKNITAIDCSDATKVTLTYDDRLLLELGTVENAAKKLKTAIQIIATVDKDGARPAEGIIRLQYTDSYFERGSISSAASTSSASSAQSDHASSDSSGQSSSDAQSGEPSSSSKAASSAAAASSGASKQSTSSTASSK